MTEDVSDTRSRGRSPGWCWVLKVTVHARLFSGEGMPRVTVTDLMFGRLSRAALSPTPEMSAEMASVSAGASNE